MLASAERSAGAAFVRCLSSLSASPVRGFLYARPGVRVLFAILGRPALPARLGCCGGSRFALLLAEGLAD